MDLLKRIGLLLLAAIFAYIGLFYGLLRFLQEKDGSVVHYIVQDVAFILCGMTGVFACSQVLGRMRKKKLALIAAQPLPEVISAGLSVKSRIIAAFLMLLTGASAYATFIYPPAYQGTSILLGTTLLLALFTYTFWIQYDRDGDTLRLDRTGIKHKWFGTIAWNQIVGMYLHNSNSGNIKQSALFLGVLDRQKYLANAPWFVRWQQGVGRWPGSRMSIFMPLHPLNVDANLVERVAFKLRALHQPPMVPGWHYSMTELEFKAMQEDHDKFQVFDEEMNEFGKKFNIDRELTESEIAEGNKRMEEILSKRSVLMHELLESSNSKVKKASQSIKKFLAAGFIIFFISLYFFYLKAGSSWLFGVIAVMLVSVVANIGWKLYKLRKKAL